MSAFAAATAHLDIPSPPPPSEVASQQEIKTAKALEVLAPHAAKLAMGDDLAKFAAIVLESQATAQRVAETEALAAKRALDDAEATP